MNKHNKLIDELRTIFNKIDLIGIQIEENTDEYDPEIRDILVRVKKEMSEVQLQELIFNVFVSWFDEETAGKKGGYEDLAKKTHKVLKDFDII